MTINLNKLYVYFCYLFNMACCFDDIYKDTKVFLLINALKYNFLLLQSREWIEFSLQKEVQGEKKIEEEIKTTRQQTSARK